MNDDMKINESLINDASVNISNYGGTTSLNLAAQKGQAPVIEYLLNAAIDANV